MPYLTSARKAKLNSNSKQPILNAGDLTYLLFTNSLLNQKQYNSAVDSLINRFLPKNPRYENLVVVLGCLFSTSLELRRRKDSPVTALWLMIYAEKFYNDVIAPYEDKKIQENGDVYCD